MERGGVPAKWGILASISNKNAKVSSLFKFFSESVAGAAGGHKSFVTSRSEKPGEFVTGAVWGLKWVVTSYSETPVEVYTGVNTRIDNSSEKKVVVQVAPEGEKVVGRVATEEVQVAPEEGEKLVVPVAPEEGKKGVVQLAPEEVMVPVAAEKGEKVVVLVAPEEGERVVLPMAVEGGERVVVLMDPEGERVVAPMALEEGDQKVMVPVALEEGEKVGVEVAPVPAKESILVRVWKRIDGAFTWTKAKVKLALKLFSVPITDTVLRVRSFVTSTCPEKLREVLPEINTQIENLSEKKLVELQGVPEEGSLLHEVKMLVQKTRKVVNQWLRGNSSLEMMHLGLKLKRSLDLVDGFIELLGYHKQPAPLIIFLLVKGYLIYRSSSEAGEVEIVSAKGKAYKPYMVSDKGKGKAYMVLSTFAALILSSRTESGYPRGKTNI